MNILNVPKQQPLSCSLGVCWQHLVKSDFLSSPVSKATGPAASNFRACYLLSPSLLPLAALRLSVWPQI